MESLLNELMVDVRAYMIDAGIPADEIDTGGIKNIIEDYVK